MPDYKIVAQTYLDRLYEPGDVLRGYTGPENKAMVLIDPPAVPTAVDEDDAAVLAENPPIPFLKKRV